MNVNNFLFYFKIFYVIIQVAFYSLTLLVFVLLASVGFILSSQMFMFSCYICLFFALGPCKSSCFVMFLPAFGVLTFGPVSLTSQLKIYLYSMSFICRPLRRRVHNVKSKNLHLNNV